MLYWCKWVGLAGMSLAWAVLFHRHYWNAAVPAFGDIDIHIAALRRVLWRYVGVGAALGGLWILNLYYSGRQLGTADQALAPGRVRQRGHDR